jgi:hypothetical protein
MRYILFIVSSCLSLASFGQKDTTIDEEDYTIIARFNSGKVKSIGQFGQGCSDTLIHKHGKFITYNEKGEILKERVYFYDSRVNKRILGLKQGWWGFYGFTKYFLGIVRARVITDPCF